MKKKSRETVVEQPKQKVAEEEVVDTPKKEEITEETTKEAVELPKQEQADDPRVDAILKLYPQYEKVYIDSRGFVFTVDTPENQRNDAVLYNNKYYQK